MSARCARCVADMARGAEILQCDDCPGVLTHAPAMIIIRSRVTGNDTSIVALAGGKEIGRVKVHVTMIGYAYLSRLHVSPDMRRFGIGRALMSEAIALHGGARMELICSAHGDYAAPQDALIAFYARLGFRFGPSANTGRPARDSDARRMFRNPYGRIDNPVTTTPSGLTTGATS